MAGKDGIKIEKAEVVAERTVTKEVVKNIKYNKDIYKIGDKIVISQGDFRGYEESVSAYIAEIFYRLNKRFGLPEKFLRLLRDTLDRVLSEGSDEA